jgi:Tfp pilus assembly protein PilX
MTGFAVVLVVALLAITGLVVDGARVESAHVAALHDAQQAARAGAAALGANPRQGTLAPAPRAVVVAQDWLAGAGHPGTATVSGERVVVTIGPYPLPTTLLALVGIGHLSVAARASARAIDRSTGPGP